jgi:hypothetical protein
MDMPQQEKTAMTERNAGGKTRKLKKEGGASAASAAAQVGIQPTGGPVPSPFEKAVLELQGLHDLLLSGDLDPHILADFRDAVNRVRTAAWAAQQYVARKDTDEGPSSVLSLLAGERIRATYQLCQAIHEDLKRTDIEFQAGSLI